MLVSRDVEATNIFSDVFGEMGIQVQHHADELKAGQQLDRCRFEAIVLDFDSVENMEFVIKCVQDSRSSRDALLFGLATDLPALQVALEKEINVPFHRPLQRQRVLSILYAAYELMLRGRRRYFRYGVSVPVRLKRRTGEHVACNTINISQNGAALRIPCPLELGEELEIIFVIPETEGLILARGVVIWDDRHGKAGIRFECCSPPYEKRLSQWLDTHFVESTSAPQSTEPV